MYIFRSTKKRIDFFHGVEGQLSPGYSPVQWGEKNSEGTLLLKYYSPTITHDKIFVVTVGL